MCTCIYIVHVHKQPSTSTILVEIMADTCTLSCTFKKAVMVGPDKPAILDSAVSTLLALISRDVYMYMLVVHMQTMYMYIYMYDVCPNMYTGE